MHFTSYFVVLTLAAATASAATTHQVAVGQNGLQYAPNTTYAAVGDTVVFTFYPRNHNVVQGSFDTPCMSNSTGGIYSGFIPSTTGVANRTFQVTINDTNPIWFYCSQQAGGGHCTAGMVGVINPPNTTDMTLAMYAAGAAQVANTSYTTPSTVEGGVVVLNTTATASGSATSSNSSATSTGGSGGASTTSSSATQATTTGAAAVVDIETWGFGAVAGSLALALF